MTVAFGSEGSLTFDISSFTPREMKMASDVLYKLHKKRAANNT